MTVNILIVCVLFALVLYTNVLFPAGLLLFSSAFKKKKYSIEEDFQPTVSILMAVFNEEKIIREKIESVFETDYPLEKLELLIGSDNSTDQTHAIIQEFIEKGLPIQLKIFTTRQGKPSIINQLYEKATGEIFILTDANVLFTENTIHELCKNFSDPTIGVVGANFVNYNLKKEGISNQEDTYIRLETKLKQVESDRFGKMIGAFGGCFATRKSLYEKVPSNLVLDDFYISMKIAYKNYDSILAQKAVVYEDLPNSLKLEFNRKVRMTVGNFQNLFLLRKKLFSFRFLTALFWSHKGLRWLTPMLTLLGFCALIPLAFGNYHLQIALLAVALIVFIVPLFERLLFNAKIHVNWLRNLSYFIFMNIAVLAGTFKYLLGIQNNIWKPTERLN